MPLTRSGRLALLALFASLALPVAAAAGARPDGEAPERPAWGPAAAELESAARIAQGERILRWHQEPTPAQLALDALAYELDLTIDPPRQRIEGRVDARFRVAATQAGTLELDLVQDLLVSGVWVNGAACAWTHADDRLAVTLDRTYLLGEELTARVAYGGSPAPSHGAFVFTQVDGRDLVYSLSEPFGARAWWPCDDWPADKADSVGLRVAVPHGCRVASNGRLVRFAAGAAQDTFTWQAGYPIATYLVSVAVHPYAITSSAYVPAAGDTLPLVFYDFPGHAAQNAELNGRVPAMLARFEELYGPYPFAGEKYGHAEVTAAGALEHQTCSSLGVYTESIVAHELAHQWWGDLVTCADFHHIWLNEGFAVYSEALWLEHAHGPQAYWDAMEANRYYGSGTVHVPDLSSWARIFDVNLTYHKAAWVVHMLRHVLGDDRFDALLHAYRAAFGGGGATTEDLRDLAESIAGRDLDDFFQQWIYGEYFPVYSYRWQNLGPGGAVELLLEIDQVQTNAGVFHMPIDVRAHLVGGGTLDFVVDNAAAHETYALPLPAPADYVEIDPDRWILRQIREPIEAPALDQGTLLVNGLDWATYGQTLRDLFAQRAFWGDLEIEFWDCFGEPVGGYPAALPDPRGHGRVPSTVLGRYGNVVWLGNDWNGDLDCWINTAVQPYLTAGGNLLLLAREGPRFLDVDLRDYLGIQWSSDRTIYQCRAAHPALTDIARTGTQNACQLFATDLTQPESALLFVDAAYNPDQGVGVLRAPAGGGSHDPHGARLAFLSGRPYRWAAGDLATNVEAIVGELFAPGQAVGEEPSSPSGATTPLLALRVASPTRDAAVLHFEMSAAEPAVLRVLDAQGRHVATLLDGPAAAGAGRAVWNGRTGTGAPAAAGCYQALLTQGDTRRAVRFVLLK